MTENHQNQDESRWLTFQEIADDLEVSDESVRRWASGGREGFPQAVSIGPRLRKVSRAAYETWKEEQFGGGE